MIVICNTSPLTNLAAVGQFSLLQSMFGAVYISAGVEKELSAGGTQWPGAAEVAAADWVHTRQVGNRQLVEALRLDLDVGEAETIALALELQGDLVLLDEQDGRHAAQYLKLKVMGVVGLLVRARQQGLVSEIRPHLDALRQQAGFYLSQPLYLRALHLVGE